MTLAVILVLAVLAAVASAIAYPAVAKWQYARMQDDLDALAKRLDQASKEDEENG